VRIPSRIVVTGSGAAFEVSAHPRVARDSDADGLGHDVVACRVELQFADVVFDDLVCLEPSSADLSDAFVGDSFGSCGSEDACHFVVVRCVSTYPRICVWSSHCSTPRPGRTSPPIDSRLRCVEDRTMRFARYPGDVRKPRPSAIAPLGLCVRVLQSG